MKQAKPLVSILVATYNGEQYLSTQLQSILDQTYPNIEVVISDDGSSDGTLEIITKFQKNHPDIFVIKNTSKKGVTNNFINAYHHSHGEYLALCDQDDYWLPQKIATMVAVIGENDLAYHDSLLIDENGKSLNVTMGDRLNFYSGNNPITYLMQNCVAGHASLITKRGMEKALPFPEGYYHDWWLATVASANNGVLHVPEVLVHYRQHSKSQTDTLSIKETSRHIRSWEKYNEELGWFKHCATIKTTQHPFLKEWYLLYQKKATQWFCPKLFILGLTNASVLYSTKKKGKLSVLFDTLQLLWGIPLRKLF